MAVKDAETLLREVGWPAGDPRLVALIPLIYVAWASGSLDPGELAIIGERVASLDWPEEGRRAVVDRWLNPKTPPPAAALRALLNIIRVLAQDLPHSTRRTLAGLGIELARAAGGDAAGGWATLEVSRALAEIEEALGVDTAEAWHELLIPEGRRPQAAAVEAAAAFDVGVLSRLLGGAYRDTRRAVLELLCDPRFRYRYGLDRATYRAQVHEWCRALAAEGLGSAGYPREHGGAGDIGRFIATFETLGLHDLSLAVKFGVQFGHFGGSINMLGSERHRAAYLRDVASLALPGCFAMSEAGHGSNVRDIETVARFDGASGEFVIHTPTSRARKAYVGNAALHARMATVFAQLEIDGQRYGVHAFLVPIRDAEGRLRPGVRVEDSGEKLGLNGVDNGTIWFDQVRVPRENLLNAFGDVGPDGSYASPIVSDSQRFFTMLGTLVAGRAGIAAVALSAAKSALTIAVRYGARRRQFGPPGAPETPILDYLTHQRRLMPPLATAIALDFAIKHLVRSYLAHRDERTREVEVLAAGLKAYSTWHTVRTVQTCREACGAAGYLAINRLAALQADTEAFTTFEGENTVLFQAVARALLTLYRHELEETQVLGMLRQLTAQAARAISELNPIITRMTDEAHLRDAEFQLGALRFREDYLLVSAAKRIKKRMSRGVSSFDTFNECQDHLVSLALAHVERVIFEQFHETIGDCPDPIVAGTLATLRDLFALSRIEADSGWFLESGYIERNKARAIRKQVNRLCSEVRRQAVHLVDAFAIPDDVLGAPIGRKDIAGPEPPQ